LCTEDLSAKAIKFCSSYYEVTSYTAGGCYRVFIAFHTMFTEITNCIKRMCIAQNI